MPRKLCSSSSSDVSCKPCCKEPKCCKKDCCIEKCECLCPEELYCMYKDAVVEVHSEFILLGASGPAGNANGTGATGGTPLGTNSRADILLEGNGFFIKGHYIVCPAQLVLMPPSLTSVA